MEIGIARALRHARGTRCWTPHAARRTTIPQDHRDLDTLGLRGPLGTLGTLDASGSAATAAATVCCCSANRRPDTASHIGSPAVTCPPARQSTTGLHGLLSCCRGSPDGLVAVRRASARALASVAGHRRGGRPRLCAASRKSSGLKTQRVSACENNGRSALPRR